MTMEHYGYYIAIWLYEEVGSSVSCCCVILICVLKSYMQETYHKHTTKQLKQVKRDKVVTSTDRFVHALKFPKFDIAQMGRVVCEKGY